MFVNVLSLCDGMSCGQIALKELGIKVDSYYASEVDGNAIKVTQDNFPNTIQMGDVIALSNNEELLSKLPKIDLIMFGFPCRSLSVATAGTKHNNGLEGVSGIFYNCLKILNWIKEHNKRVAYTTKKVYLQLLIPCKADGDNLAFKPLQIQTTLQTTAFAN